MPIDSSKTRDKIDAILKDRLSASYIEIVDESWKHAGHASAGGGGHFILTVVSERFDGLNLINRNRLVFDTLKELMERDIHALSIKAKTPKEWQSGK